MVNTLPQDQSGNVQVVSKEDPVTGKIIQELVNIVLDEDGQPMELPVDLPKDESEILCEKPQQARRQRKNKPPVKVVSVQDPITGETVQQLVQTVIDPRTGQAIQVPVNNAMTDPLTGKQTSNTPHLLVHNLCLSEQSTTLYLKVELRLV